MPPAALLLAAVSVSMVPSASAAPLFMGLGDLPGETLRDARPRARRG